MIKFSWEAKTLKTKEQMSEAFLTGAILSVVGGYFDAYTYIARGGVFANAQTGNIVLLGVKLMQGDFLKALTYFIPIFAFVLGVFVAEYIKKFGNSRHLHWRQIIILIEILIVTIAAFMPNGEKGFKTYDMIVNIAISFICSLQVQSFRKIHGIACATTMCTGNMRSFADHLVHYADTKEKQSLKNAVKYFLINLFFIIGAIISAFLTNIFNEFSVIFCIIGLLAVFLLMFKKPFETTH